MSTISRVCLSLAGFLAIAGAVYEPTSHEPAGTTLFLAAAATFCFVGLVSRMEARRAAGSEPGEEAEVFVAPTIWPFGFAVAAVIIALGLVVGAWLLIVGAIAFALSAAGWIRDVARSRAHAGRP
ncbi:MAG: cytochrome c oxidase subunit 4 [Actinomycetota bacterium]